jgi:uroporphyrinogen III methyltransferase/synthase
MKPLIDSELDLAGKKIVLTRASHQVKEFSEKLKEHGAIPIEIPTIKIVSPLDGGEKIQGVLNRLEVYNWVIFTSTNGVDWFFSSQPQIEKLKNIFIAAIGPSTARKLRQLDISVDLVPDNHVIEGLLDVFPEAPPDGRVLIPRAAIARNVLPDTLKSLGWLVDDVEVYRTIIPAKEDKTVELLKSADAIIFTSSSTVQNFISMFGIENTPELVVSIGPITSQTIKHAGLVSHVEASPSSTAGIIQALRIHYSMN